MTNLSNSHSRSALSLCSETEREIMVLDVRSDLAEQLYNLNTGAEELLWVEHPLVGPHT